MLAPRCSTAQLSSRSVPVGSDPHQRRHDDALDDVDHRRALVDEPDDQLTRSRLVTDDECRVRSLRSRRHATGRRRWRRLRLHPR